MQLFRRHVLGLEDHISRVVQGEVVRQDAALPFQFIIQHGAGIGRHNVGGHGLNAVVDDPVQRAAEGIRRVAIQAEHEGRIDHHPPLVDIIHCTLSAGKTVLPLVNGLE